MNDELKELLKNAKSEAEAKAIIDANRQNLSDEELAEVAGGMRDDFNSYHGRSWDC